jgi:two-component system nitrogen regulation response regulator NtrX
MASKRILVVDDEIGIRELLSDILQDEGYHVQLAENAAAARAIRLHERPDVVLLDIWMPDCDGISLLKEWGNGGLLTMPVIMMSGHGTIDTAVEATRIGAFDFLEKPIALQKLLKTVSTALKHSEQLPKSSMSLTSLGKSPIVLEVKDRLDKVAQSNNLAPVLLIGARGSCSELCARFLHKAETPWLHLTEFGQLVSAPIKILESIQDGVLFISEVAELGKIEQKGLALLIAKSEKYRVRVICGTAKHLPQLQAEGLFETVLLQLLSGISIRLPALEEHKEDIPDLVTAMANIHFEVLRAEYREFDIAALNALRNATWPGDLAQLDTVVRNLIQTSLGEKITLEDVNRILFQFDQMPHQVAAVSEAKLNEATPAAADEQSTTNFNQPLREARDEFERKYFEYHLKANASNMSKLAEVSGLERTHLYRKLKQLGVNPKGQ